MVVILSSVVKKHKRITAFSICGVISSAQDLLSQYNLWTRESPESVWRPNPDILPIEDLAIPLVKTAFLEVLPPGRLYLHRSQERGYLGIDDSPTISRFNDNFT